MIRLILKRYTADRFSGAEREEFETLDIDCPQLEKVLTRGGYDQSSYDYTLLQGAEVLRKEGGGL